MIHPFEIPLRT